MDNEEKKKISARHRKQRFTLSKRKSVSRKHTQKKYRASLEGKRNIKAYEENEERKEGKAAYDESAKGKA